MKHFLLLLTLLVLPLSAQAEISLFGDPPVIKAVKAGDAEALRAALLSGENPNSVDVSSKTALMTAVENDQPELVKLLLEHRATVDRADEAGNTPLHAAAERGAPEMADLLLKAGARVDNTNRDGLTPLMIAAKNGRAETVRRLLRAGADRERHDYTGRSAADWARDGRNQLVVSLLSSAP